MSIRESFVARFGEENATRVEEAAIGHMGGPFDVHEKDKWGDDPFKYLLMVCIGRDCFTRWREWHKIDASYEDILAWVLEEADLHTYEGDIPDYMALMVGAYNPWINWEKMGDAEPSDIEHWRTRNHEWAHMSEVEHEAEHIVNNEMIRDLAERGREILNKDHEEGPL